MESRSYTDFEPHSHWVHGEETDTLIVDVSGFSKEQMKVLINTSGNLKISGERPLDGDRKSRFLKYFAVPKNCNPKGIQAKFDKDEGLLYVVLPKSLSRHACGSSQGQLTQPTQLHHEESPLRSENTASGAFNPQKMTQSEEKEMMGEGISNIAMGTKKNNLLLVGVLMAIIIVAGIGTYMGLKWRQV